MLEISTLELKSENITSTIIFMYSAFFGIRTLTQDQMSRSLQTKLMQIL